MEILKVEHLKKTYGEGENAVHALDDVSFSVEKGEFVAIIGPSGSGKSTLLHILGAVDVPTSGKVYMGGQDVFAQNEEELAVFRRRQVGLIYQFYNLIPVLNVRENITLPILMVGARSRETSAGHDSHAAPRGKRKASSEPAFRWSAAESFHWKSIDECTGSCACRRTDR